MAKMLRSREEEASIVTARQQTTTELRELKDELATLKQALLDKKTLNAGELLAAKVKLDNKPAESQQ